MTIFLRNDKNQSLLDCEVWKKDGLIDVSAVVPIKTYSHLLIFNSSKQDYIIESFDDLQELRGWYWEQFIEQNENPTLKETVNAIIEKLKPIAKELDLSIITD